MSFSKLTQRYIILYKNYFIIGLPIILSVLIKFIHVFFYDLDFSKSYIISYLILPLIFDQTFILIGYFFLKRFSLKTYLIFFYTFLFLSNSIFIHHIKIYGKPPGIGAIASLIETTPQEALEFTRITPLVDLTLALLLSSVVFIGFFTIKNYSKKEQNKKKGFIVIGLLLSLITTLHLTSKKYKPFQHVSYVMQDGKNILHYFTEYVKLNNHRKQLVKKDFNPNQDSILYNKKQTHVLVIGESLNRNHMEIYGYERNTTPNLIKNKNIIVFKNVISPTTQTRSSMLRMLTESFGLNIKNEGSLITIFNQLNFKTYWLSNQTRYGISDTETSIIADEADVNVYVNNDWKSSSLDEKLLPKLDAALHDTAMHKFIVIHLIGNHFEYAKRYPKNKGFEIIDDYKFYKHNTEEQKLRINEYDASVKYTDSVVSNIINKLENRNELSTLIFTSDHGEDVYENENGLLGHGSPYVTKNTVEIPFVFWQSPAFKENRELMLTSEVLDQFYNNGNLIHSIADLLLIDFNGFDESRSIFKIEHDRTIYPFIINSNNKKINYFKLKK